MIKRSSIKEHKDKAPISINYSLNQLLTGEIACVLSDSIKIFQLDNLTRPFTIHKTESQRNCLIQLKDNNRLVFTNGHLIDIWDYYTKKHLAFLNEKDHNQDPESVLQLTNGNLLSSHYLSFIIWDMKLLQCDMILHTYNKIHCIIQLHNDQLISASYQKMLYLWDYKTLKCYQEISILTSQVFKLIQLNDKVLACASSTQLMLYDIVTNNCLQAIDNPSNDTILGIIISHDEYLISFSNTNNVLWRILPSKLLYIKIFKFKDTIMDSIELRDKRIATITNDRGLLFWNVTQKGK